VLQRAGFPAALTWLANWAREKYKLHVDIAVDPGADSARKDVRTLLFESVRELLFNAVKHAQTDRVALELALDADDRLCITVTDRGIGFEPAQLDARWKAGQVGWGLFSIRERLTMLGGRVEIDSAPGGGTQVRLVAPRGTGPGAVVEPAVVSFERVGPVPVPADRGAAPDVLRILIVDDHAAVRRALREILNERPQLAVVGDASNGFEAIAFAHTLRPDVVLMDVAMPHMDGVDATARIRAELPDIHVIGMSTQAPSESVHALEHAGAEAFFLKGADTQRLIAHLLVLHASQTVGDATRR
jgi:CheY-like chemotaxis protein